MSKSGKDKSINLSIIKNALVLDSDLSMLSIVDNYLKHAKVGVVEKCSDGEDAIKRINESLFDLVVLDWKFKKPSGVEIYHQIRANPSLSKLPILLISGSVTAADIGIAKTDPFAKFIVKPFTEEILISYISKFFSSTVNQSVDNAPSAKDYTSQTNRDEGGLTIIAGSKQNGMELHIDKNNSHGKSGLQIVQTERIASNGPSIIENEVVLKADATETKSAGMEMVIKQENQSIDAKDIGIRNSESSGGDFTFTQSSGGEIKTTDLEIRSTGQSGSLDEANSQTRHGVNAKDATQSVSFKTETSGSNQANKSNKMMLDAEGESNAEGSPLVADEALVSKHTNVLCTASVLGTQTDILAPRKVVVVDQDTAQQILLTQYLNELGVVDVSCYDDSKEAWEHILKGDVDLIVMDWKLKGLRGLGLYSRIREFSKTARIPMIVSSGLAHKGDFRILGESYYTTFLEKPIKKKPFEQAIKDTLVNAATNDKIAALVKGLIDRVKHDYALTMRTIEGMLKNIAKPFMFVLAAGQRLLEVVQLELAEKVLKIAQQLDSENVTVATELSKIYLRTGRCELAKKLLSKASVISPDSVERLCLMGEIGLTMSDTVAARRAFEEVFKIDKDHAKAIAGMTIVDGMNENKDQNILPSNFEANGKSVAAALASSLNAVAVTYAKSSQIDKAIAQYQAAMCFIYDSPTIARLQFNLGLAYLKKKKYKESQACFLTATKLAASDFHKPRIISEKLEKIFGAGSEDILQLSAQQLADCVDLTKDVESEALNELVKVEEDFQILPFSSGS
jgi:two-component system chemotaxis response regulator CheY